jgi:hypothetical protein
VQSGADNTEKGLPLLSDFPTEAKENGPALADFSVIVAIDPDWTKLTQQSQEALANWVAKGGGLVLVADQEKTFELARPGVDEKLQSIIDLYPVDLLDNRIHSVDRSIDKPHRLEFTAEGRAARFLQLRDSKDDPLAGWQEFFGKCDEKTGVAERGFHDFYPVLRSRPTASVLAAYVDSELDRQDETFFGRRTASPVPYLVTMPYGKGRVLYVGSPELWRLREHDQLSYARLWRALLNHVAAGASLPLERCSLQVGERYRAYREVPITARMVAAMNSSLGDWEGMERLFSGEALLATGSLSC